MSEKIRTVILFILLGVAIGFIYWSTNSYENNFVETL